MMQTSIGVVATERKVPSTPWLKVLPPRLQTLLMRPADNDVSPLPALSLESVQTLQREALGYLTSRQPASSLGDYLEFGATSRPSVRSTTRLLRQLGLDDVRVLGLGSQLTPALRQRHWLRKASVVRIVGDAPLADVLRSVEPLILDQAVILFDRGNGHEQAFEEFHRGHRTISASRLSDEAMVVQSFVVTRALTV